MAPSTVPPDGMENTGCQGEAHGMPAAPAAGADDHTGDSQISEHRTFHRYMDLPPKISKQIFSGAIKQTRREVRWGQPPEAPCSPLALVCKEWNEEVEKILFSEITINTLDDQEVSKFMEHFSTDRRRRFLTRLDIAINDTETGPWQRNNKSIPQIAHVMAKIGKFLQYINTWDFRQQNGSKQTIQINVSSTVWKPRYHTPNDEVLFLMFMDFWRQDNVNKFTGNGELSIDLPLEAIKSEFPRSLKMVKRLNFSPDFVPLPAARWIIQTMPNLEACHLEPMFDIRNGKPWAKLTSLIHCLRISAIDLRHLTLGNSRILSPMWYHSDAMVEFAVILREYSKHLESLYAQYFILDREFFLPWSPRLRDVDPIAAFVTPPWTWLRLKHIDLCFLDDEGLHREDEDESIDQEDDCIEEEYEGIDEEYEGIDEEYEGSDDELESRLNEVESVVDDEAGPHDPSPSDLDAGWKRDSNPKRDRLRLSPADILISAGKAAMYMPELRSAHISVTSGHAIFVKWKVHHSWPKHKITSRFCLAGCSESEERDILLYGWKFALGDRTLDPAVKDEFFQIQVACDRPDGRGRPCFEST